MKSQCWLCGGRDLAIVKPAHLPAAIDSTAFRITDAHYGDCGAVYRCQGCGFRQCSDLDDVLRFYRAMDDPDYEESRAPRALQAASLIGHVASLRGSGRLLDIGAGSGILVEEAARLGYGAEGVEPSDWLAQRARERGLAVHHGVLPMASVLPPFDVVTLVDVIEHVSDPVGLLRGAREVMAADGLGLVVTPDVASLAARLLGHRWWHYRVAHICYFTRRTLLDALARAGLAPVKVFRPAWYFSAGYLLDRMAVYAPPVKHLRTRAADRVTVPLNLFDSLAVIFRIA